MKWIVGATWALQVAALAWYVYATSWWTLLACIVIFIAMFAVRDWLEKIRVSYGGLGAMIATKRHNRAERKRLGL